MRSRHLGADVDCLGTDGHVFFSILLLQPDNYSSTNAPHRYSKQLQQQAF